MPSADYNNSVLSPPLDKPASPFIGIGSVRSKLPPGMVEGDNNDELIPKAVSEPDVKFFEDLV